MNINFTINIWKEGDMFVSHAPELDVSSCGKNREEAKKNIMEAVAGFIEEADHIGTLQDILEEAGYIAVHGEWKAPEILFMEKQSLAV